MFFQFNSDDRFQTLVNYQKAFLHISILIHIHIQNFFFSS